MSGSIVFFHIISWTAQFSKKKSSFNLKCVFWFSLQILSMKFLILRTIDRDITINVLRSSRKIFILVKFQWNLNFLDKFSKKNLQIPNSWKSVHWKPNYYMRTDGCTGRQADRQAGKYFPPPWLFVTLLYFSNDRSKCSSPSFSSTAFQNIPGISDLLSGVSKFHHRTKLCSKCSTLLVLSLKN
jgi:hypothetical protein